MPCRVNYKPLAYKTLYNCGLPSSSGSSSHHAFFSHPDLSSFCWTLQNYLITCCSLSRQSFYKLPCFSHVTPAVQNSFLPTAHTHLGLNQFLLIIQNLFKKEQNQPCLRVAFPLMPSYHANLWPILSHLSNLFRLWLCCYHLCSGNPSH